MLRLQGFTVVYKSSLNLSFYFVMRHSCYQKAQMLGFSACLTGRSNVYAIKEKTKTNLLRSRAVSVVLSRMEWGEPPRGNPLNSTSCSILCPSCDHCWLQKVSEKVSYLVIHRDSVDSLIQSSSRCNLCRNYCKLLSIGYQVIWIKVFWLSLTFGRGLWGRYSMFLRSCA